MNGRHLDRIAKRLQDIREWLGEDSGYRRAASVPSTPGGLRETRAAHLRRLLEDDLPDLIQTVREYNLRSQQGKCRFCGQQLRLIPGPRAGLYATTLSETGVICEDPNCPSPDSPDGKHKNGRTPGENGAGE